MADKKSLQHKTSQVEPQLSKKTPKATAPHTSQQLEDQFVATYKGGRYAPGSGTLEEQRDHVIECVKKVCC